MNIPGHNIAGSQTPSLHVEVVGPRSPASHTNDIRLPCVKMIPSV